MPPVPTPILRFTHVDNLARNKGVSNHSQFEIVDDLEAALEQFRPIANDLGSDTSEKVT